MKIGIAGHISTESVKDLIEGDTSSLPKGYPGAPFLGTLIKTLIKNGHQVSAYTLDTGLPPSQKTPLIATGQNFKIYYGPYRKHSIRPNEGYLGRSLDMFYVEIQALKKAIALDQPDIVHAHWSYEFALAGLQSRRPCVVTCHDSPLQVLKYMPNLYRFGRLLMAMRVFRQAKFLTAVSPYLKDEIARFTKAKVSVIPNPTPREPLGNQNGMSEKQPDLNSPAIVMVLNGWDGRKNSQPAMAAFSRLLENKPQATLHLFGFDFQTDGPAHLWAKQNNMARNMIFHGPTPNAELLDFLTRSATLLLHPALEECCPLSLIEAMALGLPVVGGEKSGGVPWVLDYGKAGILANVKEPEDMAKKMNAVLDDPFLYSELRSQAIERVRQVFDQDMITAAYEGIYLEVLDSK